MEDFSKLYPGKEHLLDLKWVTFCNQMLKIIEHDVNDKSSLDILTKFKNVEFKSDKILF